MNRGRQWRAFNNERRLMGVHEESMEKEFTVLEDNKRVAPCATRKQCLRTHTVLPTDGKRA